MSSLLCSVLCAPWSWLPVDHHGRWQVDLSALERSVFGFGVLVFALLCFVWGSVSHCSPRLAGNYNSQAGSELPVTLIIPQPPKQASLQPKGHLFSSAETLSLLLDLSQNNPNGQLLIQILPNPVSHPLQVPCWVWIVKAAQKVFRVFLCALQSSHTGQTSVCFPGYDFKATKNMAMRTWPT